MTRAGVDNSNLALKVALRWRHLPEGKVTVLDCFHGEGAIWGKLQELLPGRIEVDSIEQAIGKGRPDFCGDNRKLLPVLDLSPYNAIDLDAYGSPARQVAAIFANPTLAAGTVVYYTTVRVSLGMAEHWLLFGSGFSAPMTRKAPILCSKWGYRAFLALLSRLGVREVSEVSLPCTGGERRYGVFKVLAHATDMGYTSPQEEEKCQ